MRPRDGVFGRVLPEVEPFVAERPAWMGEANCRGVNVHDMFPGRGDYEGMEAAKALCRECVCVADCLAYALDNHIQFGVWGARSERERRRMRRRLAS